MRGGLTLVFGVLTGNAIGFARVALTAFLLGTDNQADALAVAMGPIDTVNALLINSVVFAFVPMLTARAGPVRSALFQQLTRCFLAVSALVSIVVMLSAPLLMRALAPGLAGDDYKMAVAILRILALSCLATGTGAVHCALLYTAGRFAPTAFYQAALNVSTIVCALALWRFAGVYAFAIGYTLGAWLQLGIVWFAARRGLEAPSSESGVRWRELLTKPAFFVVYAAGLSANILYTRAFATHAGPGMAAALDYCMRCVGVPLALLVNPISNSLLPEMARRSVRDALRLIDRTVAFTALVAVAGCAFGGRGVPRLRPQPDRLEPDRDHGAVSLWDESSVATGDRRRDPGAGERGGFPKLERRAGVARRGLVNRSGGRIPGAVRHPTRQAKELVGQRLEAAQMRPMSSRMTRISTMSPRPPLG
ncbi:MAG: virulence factor family protein [Burkholderiales bacterium]|nr:virulence factor family protein [Burkholderiales bacterium]